MSIEANIIVKLKYTYRQHKSTALDRHIDSLHKKILVCLYLNISGQRDMLVTELFLRYVVRLYGKHAVYS
jgi:uncharacterized membrane protein